MKTEDVPYVSNHAIDRFMEMVRETTRDKARKTIHWGWFTGSQIKKEFNGTVHVHVFFDKDIKKSEKFEGVLVVSPTSDKYSKRLVVKTILRMDHYLANVDMSKRSGRKKKTLSGKQKLRSKDFIKGKSIRKDKKKRKGISISIQRAEMRADALLRSYLDDAC